MRLHALAVGIVLGALAAGCAQAPVAEVEEKPELSPELKALVLDEAPSDVPNPTLIDFGGKASLIGYTVEPAKLAAPGSKLSLKLFWRCTGKLTNGYQVYTELVTPGGRRFAVEGTGPVRQGALNPSNWEPGKIYIDELDVTVPEELEAARFAIVVGLKTAPVAPPEPEAAKEGEEKADEAKDKPVEGTFGQVYLSVLSGLSDDKHGGVVATLETGVVPGTKRARTGKDDKRPLAGGKRPASALGKSPLPAKPRDPAARPMPVPAPAKAP
jgi:hypothetical protein